MSQEDFQQAARLRDEAAALRKHLPPVAQYVMAQLQELQAASSTQKQTEVISALGGTLLNATGNHPRRVKALRAALCCRALHACSFYLAQLAWQRNWSFVDT